MSKLKSLVNKDNQKINIIKTADGRLRESIRNIEIQNYLCKIKFNTEENNNSKNNKNINRQKNINKIYKYSILDFSDKRNIFKSMYGEFWNIKNFENYPSKGKKKSKKIEFDEEKLLIKRLLSKLKTKNVKRLFQSKSNTFFYRDKNKYFNKINKTNFNNTNYNNSYQTNNFNKNLTIYNNISRNKYNPFDLPKNKINNYSEKQKNFKKFVSLSLPKFKTISYNDKKLKFENEKNKRIENINLNNKILINDINTFQKPKINKIKKYMNNFLLAKKNNLEIETKTKLIVEENKSIQKQIFCLKNQKFKINEDKKTNKKKKKDNNNNVDKNNNDIINNDDNDNSNYNINDNNNDNINNDDNDNNNYNINDNNNDNINNDNNNNDNINGNNNDNDNDNNKLKENQVGQNNKENAINNNNYKNHIYSKTKYFQNYNELVDDNNRIINKMNNPKEQIKKYIDNKKNNDFYSFNVINNYIFDNKKKDDNEVLFELLKPSNLKKDFFKINGKFFLSQNHYKLTARLNVTKNEKKLNKYFSLNESND